MKANSFSSYAQPFQEIIKIIINKKILSKESYLWKTAKTSWKNCRGKNSWKTVEVIKVE